MYKKIRHPERPLVLHIFIGCEPKAISQKLNRIKGNKVYFPSDFFVMSEETDAFTFDMGEGLSGHLAIVFRNNTSVESISHEAMHCVAHHFRYIGQPLDINSEESYAYMVGWITGIVHKMVTKK